MRLCWKNLSLFLLIFISLGANAQKFLDPSDTLNIKRRNIVLGSSLGITAVTLTGLQVAWYSDYQSDGFHFFNDWQGWQQVDKFGHAATNYQICWGVHKMYRWTGMDHNKAMWTGFALGTGYQAVVEVMDGFSDDWGFSWGDIGFNTLGGVAFLAQEWAWQEQRINLKYSFTPINYNQYEDYEARRLRNLYGATIFEQWLKDYNAQTYWVSANIWSLVGKPDRFPKWINVALGYSANNMFGAESNTWKDPDDPTNTLSSSLIPERQFLLSLDVDLSRMDLPPYLNWTKSVFGLIKIPFPALEWNNKRGLQGHLLYF